jgi:hypothetical protein
VYLTVISREGQPGVPLRVCDGCKKPACFSADGQKLLFIEREGERSKVTAVDIASGQKTELMNADAFVNARLSPDAGWLLFTALSDPHHERLWIAPLDHAVPVPQSEWILVGETERGHVRQASWAPDANLIYLISEHDGFRCIWAQRLNSKKHPTGPASPVKHFHGSLSMMPITDVPEIGLSVTGDRLFFSLVESSGNIWLAQINQP